MVLAVGRRQFDDTDDNVTNQATYFELDVFMSWWGGGITELTTALLNVTFGMPFSY